MIILPELQICAASIKLVGCISVILLEEWKAVTWWDVVASFVSALFAAQMDIQN